jgi:hypothetical protein
MIGLLGGALLLVCSCAALGAMLGGEPTAPPVPPTATHAATLPPVPSAEGTPIPDDVLEPDVPEAYYPNCAAARAAGVAPLSAGDPGYRKALDRDGDGVACD